MRTRAPTTRDVEDYRKALLALAARPDRNLARERREFMRADEPDVPGGPIPSTEPEDNAGLQEVELGLVANESSLLAEVTTALRRIDTGTFGRCAACKRPVGRARLKAVPYARECIRCARATRPAGR